MNYKSSYLWEKNSRSSNEDSLCICEIRRNSHNYLLAVVCDGIGGLQNGEDASSYCVKRLRQCFENALNKNSITRKGLKNTLLRELCNIHETLYEYGIAKNIRLGTTVCMAVLCDRQCLFVSVGDSMAFYGKRLFTPATQNQCNSQGQLTNALGIGKLGKHSQHQIWLWKGMKILVCSDGFYKRTMDELCTSKLSLLARDFESFLTNNYFKAVNRGEHDNASAILVECV